MKTINYGWIIVGIGLLVNMAGLGFGRFAYPLLIPDMRGALGFNFREMGLLSGAIMLGYLLFSLLGGMLTTRLGSKRIVVASLLCGALSMFCIGRSSEFFPLLAFAFAMGAGGAGTHISMATLPMAWFNERRLGRALGIVTGGTGLGIILTGLLLPHILLSFGKEAWRLCWLLLSLITFLVAVMGWIGLREKPNQTAILPFSSDGKKESIPSVGKRSGLTLQVMFIIYFIFGFAYNIYATYFVAYMVEDLQLPEKTAGNVWAIFGWMCMCSGWIWGLISDRLGRRRALIWNNGIIAFSALLPVLLHQPFFLGFAALLFGGTFLGTVVIIAAAVGDRVVEKRGSVYGRVTLTHGIGQLLGTTWGGYLKDLTGSFQWNLICSLVGFLLCVGLAAFNKER
jgi:MFS family permease